MRVDFAYGNLNFCYELIKFLLQFFATFFSSSFFFCSTKVGEVGGGGGGLPQPFPLRGPNSGLEYSSLILLTIQSDFSRNTLLKIC